MEFIISAIAVLVVWIVGTLVTEQTKASASSLATWLAQRAAARLPEELRAANEEEWLAVLANTAGPLLKLLTAIGFHRGVGEIASQHLCELQRGAAEGTRQRDARATTTEAKAHLLVDTDDLVTYQLARNFIAHTVDPTSDESIGKLGEYLGNSTERWSVEQIESFYMRALELLDAAKKNGK